MIDQAKQRGFAPELVIFDSWYASLENLKLIRRHGWHWLTQLKANRLVSTDRSGNRPISDVFIPSSGAIVHLKGYGWIKVFKTVGTNGDVEYWATSRLEMTLCVLVRSQGQHHSRGSSCLPCSSIRNP